jgi:molecular chaperone HscB
MNHFELFDIPIAFKLDEALLTRSYLQKQLRFHPDTKNVELNSRDSANINEAYNTLLNPIKRAKYFLKLHGIEDPNEMPQKLTSEAFVIREKYDSLKSQNDKEKFQKSLSCQVTELIADLCALENNIDEFRKKTIMLSFIGSFLERIKANVYGRN